MKKSLWIILLIVLMSVFIIICLIYAKLNKNEEETKELIKYNLEYEEYTKKQITGAELATLIGKAVKQNEKNKIKKDENNYFIENKENSIKIYLKMITIENTYPMEEIYNNKISEFVKNFNDIMFICTNVEYHDETGKISKMIFEEQI